MACECNPESVDDKKVQIIRNLSAQEIWDSMTISQQNQMQLVAVGIFDLTFDSTFE